MTESTETRILLEEFIAKWDKRSDEEKMAAFSSVAGDLKRTREERKGGTDAIPTERYTFQAKVVSNDFDIPAGEEVNFTVLHNGDIHITGKCGEAQYILDCVRARDALFPTGCLVVESETERYAIPYVDMWKAKEALESRMDG